jgi:hypothetical protein
MENFNELFEQAALVADHRTKVFNQLIEKTVNEILPKFCEACANLDINTVFLKTSSNPFEVAKQHDEDGNIFYAVGINVNDKTYCCADYDLYIGKYKDSGTDYKIEDASLKRTGIVELVNVLNSRLSDYLKKYAEKNKEAENLL